MSQFSDELAGCLQRTIYVAKCDGADDFGELSYGAPATMAAYIEFNVDIETRSGVNEERDTDHMLITLVEIGDRDRVWLPGKDQTDAAQSRIPKAVAELWDPEVGAVSHYEIVI